MSGRVKKRQEDYLGMFNFTKGVMMVIIMLLHALMDNVGNYTLNAEDFRWFSVQFIGCASVPMFFLLCGYTIKRKSRKACILAQKVILKPYAIVILAVFLVSMLSTFLQHGDKYDYLGVFKYNVFPYFLGLNACTFLGVYVHGIGAIWFFLVFVLGSIVLNEILQIGDMFSQVVILCTMSILGVGIGVGSGLPFYFPQVLICTGYMYAGMLCKKYDIFNRDIPKGIWGLLAAGWLYMTKYGNIIVADNLWKNGVSDLIASYGAGLCMLVGLQKLNRFEGRVSERIRWIGRHSMWICCAHTVFQIAIPWNAFMGKITESLILGTLIEFGIHFAAAISTCCVINVIQKHKRRKRKIH